MKLCYNIDMIKINLPKIEMLPNNSLDPIFEQRETGVTHTPYQTELLILDCIERGDLDSLNCVIQNMGSLIIGRLSKNNTRQLQYAAVCCITLATRAAIAGGMDEMEAYNLSDYCIQKIDELSSPESMLDFLTQKLIELTNTIRKIRERAKYSKHVRTCLRYISKNLHSKITLSDLAVACGVSSDYLSFLFKKETDISVNSYILKQKLRAAKTLMKTQRDNKNIGLYFSFCSESYFISCFKKEFGMTPLQYVNSLK